MEVSLDFLSGGSNSVLFFLDFALIDIFKMEMFSEYSSKMLYLEFTVLVFVKTHDLEYPGSGSGIQFGQNSSAPQDLGLVGRQLELWITLVSFIMAAYLSGLQIL